MGGERGLRKVRLPPAIPSKTPEQREKVMALVIRRRYIRSLVKGKTPPKIPDSTEIAAEAVREMVAMAGQGQPDRVRKLVQQAYQVLGAHAVDLLRGKGTHRQRMKWTNELMTAIVSNPEFFSEWAGWAMSKPGLAMTQHIKVQPRELMVETQNTERKLILLVAPSSPEHWEASKKEILGAGAVYEGEVTNPWGDDALPIAPLRVSGG